MKNNYLAVIALVGVVLLGAYTLTRPGPVTVVDRGGNEIQVGALSSPDIASPYLSFGNVRQWAAGPGLTTATSTVCAIQSPAATTTLVHATIRFDTTATYATSWLIGWSRTMNSTSTSLAGTFTLAGNGLATYVATSSVTQLTDGQVPPLTWINFNLSTSSASATFAPTGKCSVVFREV